MTPASLETRLKPAWPRPWAPADDEWPSLPVPWSVPFDGEKATWLALRTDLEVAAQTRQCQVCGFELGRRSVILHSDVSGRYTSGPGCHPRCAALAVKFCPHFSEDSRDNPPVGRLYEGDGLGYDTNVPNTEDLYEVSLTIEPGLPALTREELVALATSDPLGVES